MMTKKKPEQIELHKTVIVMPRDHDELMFFTGEKYLPWLIRFLQKKKFIKRIKQIKKPSMTIIHIHPTYPGLIRSIMADMKRHEKERHKKVTA